MSEIHFNLISHINLPYCLTKRITFQYIVFLQEITSNKVVNKKRAKTLLLQNSCYCSKTKSFFIKYVLSDDFFLFTYYIEFSYLDPVIII